MVGALRGMGNSQEADSSSARIGLNPLLEVGIFGAPWCALQAVDPFSAALCLRLWC